MQVCSRGAGAESSEGSVGLYVRPRWLTPVPGSYAFWGL